MTFEEEAREIVDSHLRYPDWEVQGLNECFVCGTPLEKTLYHQRSQRLVEAITQKLLQTHNDALRQAMDDITDTVVNGHDDGKKVRDMNCHEALSVLKIAIRSKIKEGE